MPNGQKTIHPPVRSKAGASVRQASKATASDSAMVGPP